MFFHNNYIVILCGKLLYIDTKNLNHAVKILMLYNNLSMWRLFYFALCYANKIICRNVIFHRQKWNNAKIGLVLIGATSKNQLIIFERHTGYVWFCDNMMAKSIPQFSIKPFVPVKFDSNSTSCLNQIRDENKTFSTATLKRPKVKL